MATEPDPAGELELVAAHMVVEAAAQLATDARERFDDAILTLKTHGYSDARIAALVDLQPNTITSRRKRARP
jgi:DNA-directed RNA polymerase specialized sigma24 family protein